MEPLVTFFWILFLIWSVMIGIIWFGGIGEAELREWFGAVQTTGTEERIRQPELFSACRFLLSAADTIWIVLGAANIYLALALREGLAASRRWALAVLASIWIVSALSAWTDWPLGGIHYTARLGAKLGPVPLGWLLLLFCLIFGARDCAFGLLRNASHGKVALLSGALVAIASLPLALVAWKTRAWLIWYPGTVPAPALPPLSSYITFFLLGLGMTWFCRERNVATTSSGMGTPAVVYLIFVGFLGILAGLALV